MHQSFKSSKTFCPLFLGKTGKLSPKARIYFRRDLRMHFTCHEATSVKGKKKKKKEKTKNRKCLRKMLNDSDLRAEQVTDLITVLRSFFKGHKTFPQLRCQKGRAEKGEQRSHYHPRSYCAAKHHG